MNIATKLRKRRSVDVNEEGKKAFSKQVNHVGYNKRNLYPLVKRGSNSLCTKKHTKGRIEK
jgi:hypothetical protein